MLDKLRTLFTTAPQTSEPAIAPELAAASLMLEVSWSDHAVDDVELSAIRTLLIELFRQQDDKVDALIEDARSRLDSSVGLHPYTSYLNDHLDEAERFAVVCALWQLAMADQRVDRFEEHTIRKAADLLYLSHSRFIEAKLQAKNLAVQN